MKFIINTEEARRKDIHIFDKQTEKIIAVFKNGECETEDEIVIKKLTDLGYEPEESKRKKKNA